MMLDAVLIGAGTLALWAIGGIFMIAGKIARRVSDAELPTSGDDRESAHRAGPPA